MRKPEDLTGQKFNRLTATSRASNKSAHTRWHCVCDCGGTTISNAGNLKSGAASSCGCKRRESTSTHGLSATAGYYSWRAMVRRCVNISDKDYPRYGGRGIIVCDRWLNSPKNFISDMGEQPSTMHSIDRIDNDGDYTPDNCKWSTAMEQGRNKSNTLRAEYKGEILPLTVIAERAGIPYHTLKWRHRNGKVVC